MRTLTLLGCMLLFISILLSCGPRSGVKPQKKDESGSGVVDGLIAPSSPVDYVQAAEMLKIKGDGEKGVLLFRQNCARCHTIGDGRTIGPDLAGVYYRVPAPQGEWLKKYILNNKKMMADGDPYALKIFEENGRQHMDVFEGVLSEQDIQDIMIFMVAGK